MIVCLFAAASLYSASGQSIDFAKHNIKTIVMFSPSTIKQAYSTWENQYSYYEIKDNTLVGRIIIFAADREDEAGDLLDNSAAYIIENGKIVKTTSVKSIEDQKDALQKMHSMYDWPYVSQAAGNYATYNFGNQGQQAFINFNGKKYGPYMMVSNFVANKDLTKFFAVAAGSNSNGDVIYYLISSTGKKIKLPSMPTNSLVNIDFSHAGVYGFINTDDNSKSPSEQVNNSDIYFIDGSIKKHAVNIEAAGNHWLDPSGNNYLSADENVGAYINGKKINSGGSGAGNVWCNSDASKWCYFTSSGSNADHLIFSDGTDVFGTYHPQQLFLNGKSYMVWFQYKDKSGQELIFCIKEL